MTNPGMMPQKMNPTLIKVDVEPQELTVLRKKINAGLAPEQEKPQARKVPKKAMAAALGGKPLENDAHREVKWQKRNAKKNQAIARINRKRRPKKR